ncbi:Zinc finger protein 706 [Myotis brandtii]|uniref:Zinc finger protein 706 n=1 Tax=Myotis brandtii TaxID=109478 RepID=S7Q4N2_MYOBR|nr:Zinc finger protein 706 [Myotis brandtii]
MELPAGVCMLAPARASGFQMVMENEPTSWIHNLVPTNSGSDMARGQQKIQSQQKNAKKQAGQKKKQGHDQKAAAKAALIYTCTVCRTQMPDPKTFKQHFESKHPKTPLPPELADVQA